ncbi:MAG: hypothetical protein DMF02_02335 [Verrucomicrobia bacterium]|nr:MAG: hypothetical protein DMF02_02335 [Verrucomicrobiota bacterium]
MNHTALLRRAVAARSVIPEALSHGSNLFRILEFERTKHVACQCVAKDHLQIEIRTLIFNQAV